MCARNHMPSCMQGGAEAISVLDRCMSSQSALLKHEVAYVLGQMQDAGALDCLE